MPEPGDTARLDQLAAHWRDAPEPRRQDVAAAGQELLDNPDAAAVGKLLEALRAAGLDVPGQGPG